VKSDTGEAAEAENEHRERKSDQKMKQFFNGIVCCFM
jgi:hypothetical protein